MEEKYDVPEDWRVIEYPFHLGDLVGGTNHLSNEEFGAYMRLLIANINAQHKAGGLPDNPEILRSYARMTPVRFKRLWGLIGGKFVQEDGRVFNMRVKKTVNEILNRSSVAKANVLKRHNKESTPVQPQKNQRNTNHKPYNQENSISKGPEESAPSARRVVKTYGGDYNILFHILPEEEDQVRAVAGGWDLKAIAENFNAQIKQGRYPAPTYPLMAFIAFAKTHAEKNPI